MSVYKVQSGPIGGEPSDVLLDVEADSHAEATEKALGLIPPDYEIVLLLSEQEYADRIAEIRDRLQWWDSLPESERERIRKNEYEA